ncbi:MAG: hypothetical protein M9962_15630 [Oligoflexia bacterium]|nr:hypothetical protein [Oligoflexia bacterium]
MHDFYRQLSFATEIHEPHNTLGYKPIFTNFLINEGYQYNEEGVNLDRSIIKNRKNKAVFIGDSVTRRGKIIQSIESLSKYKTWDFYNLGVEGYNIPQSISYFMLYGKNIKPKRIILQIHNNDFIYYPMLLFTSNDTALWFFHEEEPIHFNFRLIQQSYLYENYVMARYSILNKEARRKNLIQKRSIEEIKRLKEYCLQNNIELYLVVLPLIKPTKNWTEEELRSRETSLNIGKNLNITTIDLFDSLDEYHEKSLNLTEENKEDYWHPNQFAAEILAKKILERIHF